MKLGLTFPSNDQKVWSVTCKQPFCNFNNLKLKIDSPIILTIFFSLLVF